MQCPRCLSEERIKSGIVKGKQRFRCKQCNYFYTVNKIGKQIDPYYIVKALQLHLEGLTYREIERIIGVNNVTIANWVKHYNIKRPENYTYRPQYRILTHDQLVGHLKEHPLDASNALIITPIGDKFMMIKWDRFL